MILKKIPDIVSKKEVEFTVQMPSLTFQNAQTVMWVTVGTYTYGNSYSVTAHCYGDETTTYSAVFSFSGPNGQYNSSFHILGGETYSTTFTIPVYSLPDAGTANYSARISLNHPSGYTIDSYTFPVRVTVEQDY